MVLGHLFNYAKHREERQNYYHGSHKGIIWYPWHVIGEVALFEPKPKLAREEDVCLRWFGGVLADCLRCEFKAFALQYSIAFTILNRDVNFGASFVNYVELVFVDDANQGVA